MKLMRLAMCVAIFALVGGVALSEDMDVRALQAKLAAQEARLNDLQAKMYSTGAANCGDNIADGLTSLRKNAVVTIGGQVNTRYQYFDSEIKSRFLGSDGSGTAGSDIVVAPNGNALTRGQRAKIDDTSYGKLNIADAKIDMKIDVNEHFDAYVKMDLQDGGRDVQSIAQNYWVRWKNICNSGFGVLVGRDSVKFGGIQPYGLYDNWAQGTSDFGGNVWGGFWGNGQGLETGMAIDGGMPMRGSNQADSRTVQITPYWESQDGKFTAEVSFFQEIQYKDSESKNYLGRNGYTSYSRRVNDAPVSFSTRLTWKPIEGLTLMASAMNLYADNDNGFKAKYSGLGSNGWPADNPDNGWDGPGWDVAGRMKTSDSNFMTQFGFEYRPCFIPKLNLFATWVHSWNDGWVKDQDSDSISFGFGVDILDNLTFYATGDYARAKSGQVNGNLFANEANIKKAQGWGGQLGMTYTSSYGISLDAGWRYQQMEYKNWQGEKHSKLSAHAFYTTLGFDF